MEYNERFSKLINPHYNSMLMTCREGNVVELIFLIAGIIYIIIQKNNATHVSTSSSDQMGCLVFCAVFVIVGFLVSSRLSKSELISKKYCSVEVDAEIVSYKKVYGHSEGRERSYSYAPIYGYTYNGQYYKSTSSFSGPFKPKIGKHKVLLIDPENPINFFFPDSGVATMILNYLIGVICIGVGLLIAALAFTS